MLAFNVAKWATMSGEVSNETIAFPRRIILSSQMKLLINEKNISRKESTTAEIVSIATAILVITPLLKFFLDKDY